MQHCKESIVFELLLSKIIAFRRFSMFIFSVVSIVFSNKGQGLTTKNSYTVLGSRNKSFLPHTLQFQLLVAAQNVPDQLVKAKLDVYIKTFHSR